MAISVSKAISADRSSKRTVAASGVITCRHLGLNRCPPRFLSVENPILGSIGRMET